MRTTIRLPDDLLTKLKSVAARSGKTLTDVVADALRESLRRREERTPRTRVRLATVTGQGLQRGADLDDSASLLDLVDAVGDPA